MCSSDLIIIILFSIIFIVIISLTIQHFAQTKLKLSEKKAEIIGFFTLVTLSIIAIFLFDAYIIVPSRNAEILEMLQKR